MLEPLFNKVADLKKRLQHRCFPVNIAKFLRATEHLRWLLLKGGVIKTIQISPDENSVSKCPCGSNLVNILPVNIDWIADMLTVNVAKF